MPKLDQPNKVFPAKSKFWKHNVPWLAIWDGIEILQVPNETRLKSSLIINVFQAKVLSPIILYR